MNEQLIREAMRKLEGIASLPRWVEDPTQIMCGGVGLRDTWPNYTHPEEGFNRVHRVLNNKEIMDELSIELVWDHLAKIFDEHRWCRNLSVPQVLTASPLQICVAILKALGLFTPEMEEDD